MAAAAPINAPLIALRFLYSLFWRAESVGTACLGRPPVLGAGVPFFFASAAEPVAAGSNGRGADARALQRPQFAIDKDTFIHVHVKLPSRVHTFIRMTFTVRRRSEGR